MDIKQAEDAALSHVQLAGNKGILQSELWRQLKLNSREGSRIAVKLERQGLVRRVKELSGGRWTYRLYSNEKSKPTKNFSWTSLDNCPCFVCKNIKICGVGQTVNPILCQELDIWIVQQTDNSNNGQEPEEDEK
ncbi:MAG: helix-turn-helix transcriptional regulator [Candidatus Helarchaeota archaeon]